ncbi:MAG TPA: response regulator [Geomonas sp.]|nr:response regulator [Geomonas sp.]
MSKRILIADDQMATREALSKFAAMQGYEVVAVDNGAELLSVVESEKFDAVITDLVMPGLNGVSAAEIMKLHGSSVPVIALTGIPKQDVGPFQDKFTKIYHKPVNASALLDYVNSLLSK